MPQLQHQPPQSVPVPIQLIEQSRPVSLALFSVMALNGGMASEGCSLSIAELGALSGACRAVVKRELALLALEGWISEEHQPGYATIRRIAL